MSKIISVIIPCYNVEKYIDRCLISLVNQTIGLSNLEIICIDDCSTDNTLTRLKWWESKLPENITLITYEKNLRQGGARNIGIQHASCGYIGFVDADDWVEPNMYEILYQKIIETDCDICKCKFVRDRADANIIMNSSTRSDQKYIFKEINGFYKREINNTGNNGLYGGIWSGLYKSDLIINNSIYFPEGLAYEDNYWEELLSLYVHSLYIVDLELYHYYVNFNSTIMKRNSMYHFDRLIIEQMILDEYISRDAFSIFKNDLFHSFINRYWLNSLCTIFTKFDELPDILDINQMVYTVNEYFSEYIEAMKTLPIDINTKDSRTYLLNILLSDDLRNSKSIFDIQKEYLDLYIKE